MPLVTLTELFKSTRTNGYGVGLFNVASLEFAEAIVQAAEELRAPVILGLPERFFGYFGMETVAHLCVDLATRASVPIAVHLDHGKSFDVVMKAIRFGFSSVMYDGSRLPYADNVKNTAKVVEVAHAVGVSVEGELGMVGFGSDPDTIESDESFFTKPEEAADYIEQTGVDALAIAFGTLHGTYRKKPQLDYERLKQIRERIETGIVLHGGSGLSDADFRKAIAGGVDKVNIYTEITLLALENTAKVLPQAKEWLDITKSLRLSLKELIKDRIALFGGAGMA